MRKKILILLPLFLLSIFSLWQANKDNNLLAKLPGLFYSEQEGLQPAEQDLPNNNQENNNMEGLIAQLSESENTIKGLQEKISLLEEELETYKYQENKEILGEETNTIKDEENDLATKNVKICEKIVGGIASKNSVILNEVAWMGSSISANHEWIELKNIGQEEINLEGWQIIGKDNQIEIIFGAGHKIPANGFILAERTNNEPASEITADLIYSGALRNSDDAIYLFNKNCSLEDKAEAAPNWPSGDNTSKNTMERNSDLSWQTSLNPGGTPKSENSSGKTSSSNSQQTKSSAGGGSGRSSTPKAAISLSILPENINNQEITANIEASNLKNTNWDLKISIEKEGMVLSETYNSFEEKWQNSFFYIEKAFSDSSFSGELKLKLKNEFKDFEGQADIIARIRENGKSASHSGANTINIIKSQEENNEPENNQEENEPELEPEEEPEITHLPNFIANEFFSDWGEPGENANQLHSWNYSGTASHIKRNEDSLVEQFSAQWTPITSANNLIQSGFNIEKEGIYYASLWIKPIDVSEENYIRISLNMANPETGEFPNASFVNYKITNEWINITKETALAAGNQGGIRIRAQRSGVAGPSFLLGASWFSNVPPPEEWLN